MPKRLVYSPALAAHTLTHTCGGCGKKETGIRTDGILPSLGSTIRPSVSLFAWRHEKSCVDYARNTTSSSSRLFGGVVFSLLRFL